MANPNLIVKSGEIVQDTRVLAPNEVESLQQALGAHREVLGATAAFQSAESGAAPVHLPDLRVNRKRLSEQARQIKTVLDKCSPEPVSEKDRDRFVARAKYLEEQFKPWLETRAELHVTKRDRAEWGSAMKKANERLKPNSLIEKYIAEWQSIQRRLSPEDPDAASLHRLRADR